MAFPEKVCWASDHRLAPQGISGTGTRDRENCRCESASGGGGLGDSNGEIQDIWKNSPGPKHQSGHLGTPSVLKGHSTHAEIWDPPRRCCEGPHGTCMLKPLCAAAQQNPPGHSGIAASSRRLQIAFGFLGNQGLGLFGLPVSSSAPWGFWCRQRWPSLWLLAPCFAT